MMELLWLLLPVAAASGWLAARRTARHDVEPERAVTFSSHYIKGLNYLLTEQSDRALEVFIDMVDVDPDTVETHLILGSLFRRRGEVDRAIRIHQNLVERENLDPAQRANALMELGRDYMKAGLLDQAESLFKELIQLGFLQADAYRRCVPCMSANGIGPMPSGPANSCVNFPPSRRTAVSPSIIANWAKWRDRRGMPRTRAGMPARP